MTIADDLRSRTFQYMIQILAVCGRLPDRWEAREVGRQLLRAGMGVTGNYWSACRGRSTNEFIAKLGVAVDEADESVLWLATVVEGGIRAEDDTRRILAEGKELRAILSRSHRTARENRRKRQRQTKFTNSPIRQFTKSTEGPP